MEGKYLSITLCILLWSVVFWNTENFFDWFDSGFSASDKEFSSFGERHWTKKKFTLKSEGVGKTLLWAGTPPVVGLAEIENSFVLRQITGSEVLHKKGYRFVHYESHDQRGIDVALMYLGDSLTVKKSKSIPIVDKQNGDTLATRDILYVELEHLADGSIWHFFVNHHPSKYGGGKHQGRMLAMSTLLHNMDSLADCGQRNIVAMGDFNDTPSSEAFKLVGENFINMGIQIATLNEGSIRYRGNWELIDNFICSPSVAAEMKMEILRPPFLLERDRQWPGLKPKRCYIGPRWNEGVSDHLPVALIHFKTTSE